VKEESSRDILARRLVVLVAGSGLLIALVGLFAIALLRRNAERTSQAALAVIAEQAASRIGMPSAEWSRVYPTRSGASHKSRSMHPASVA